MAGTSVWNGWDTCLEWLGHVFGMAGTRVWNAWDTCLEWLGHVFGMAGTRVWNAGTGSLLTVLRPEDTRRVGKLNEVA